MLRVLFCGSVDDGKSTLLGRLLHDTGSIPTDQFDALPRGPDGTLDLALLTDGLDAEREQGITIDVAYRHLRTPKRRMLLVDCPGHEQYTRNMATGAAAAEVAVVLVNAVDGVVSQTRRHFLIAGLMGITQFVGVVNKMDLASWSEARFRAIEDDLRSLGAAVTMPACARDGDGVARPGARMAWHTGPTLLEALENVQTPAQRLQSFRMPVQYVIRAEPGQRLYAGTVASGQISPGATIALSGGGEGVVAAVIGPGGAQDHARAGDAVAIELAGRHDVARGDVLSAAADPAPVADQFQARLVWCGEAALLPGRIYLFKQGTRTIAGSVSRIRHAIDVETGSPLAASQLRCNEVAVVNLSLAGPVAFESFADCPALGGFVVIDRQSNATLGAGTIDFALTRSANIAWHETDIDGAARARLMAQRPAVLWFTGLSGAGKSTIANLVERRLHEQGRHTYLLDGDNLRHGLCRDLGFTAADRVENVRRAAEVAALMADAGLIVLVCLISPYHADRQAARERVGLHAFYEVFVDAPVDECRRRDPKGLYEKADRGAIPNFTGVSAPYEAPLAPELHVRTDLVSRAEAANAVLALLQTSVGDRSG